jgi:phosphatidylinositol 4-kinase
MSREGRLSNLNSKEYLLLENNNEGKESDKGIINEISLEEFLYNKEKVDEEKGKDSNNDIHDSMEKITDASSEKSEEMEKQRSFSVGGKDSLNNFSEKKYYEFYNLINSKSKFGNPFGEKWLEICEKIKFESLYRNFPSYDIKSFIAKADDDLRQESLSMQLIKMMSDIFKKANIPLQLRTYEIIITSKNSGLIEFISDSISIDALKKKTYTDLNTFYRNFFENHFKEAQKNFVESLAAYSLVSYLLNLKDRHNGNIMIDTKGRIIHIDFGFILGISPGNVGFETAPFKMTKEYVNLLDGINSDIYNYFLLLLKIGFLELRKYYDSFVKVIEIMSKSKFNNI